MKDQNKYISNCTCAENMSQRVQALEKLRSTIFDSLFFRLVYVGDNKVKIVYNFARKVPLRSKKSFHTTIKASAIKIKANNQRSTKLLAPELCGLRNLESTSSFRPVHVLLLRPTYRADILEANKCGLDSFSVKVGFKGNAIKSQEHVHCEVDRQFVTPRPCTCANVGCVVGLCSASRTRTVHPIHPLADINMWFGCSSAALRSTLTFL